MKWNTRRGGKEIVSEVFFNGDEIAWLFTKSDFRGTLCGKLEKAIRKDPSIESVACYSLDKIGKEIYITAKDAKRKPIWNSSIDNVEYTLHDDIIRIKEQAKADRRQAKHVVEMQREAMFRNDASLPRKIIHKVKRMCFNS